MVSEALLANGVWSFIKLMVSEALLSHNRQICCYFFQRGNQGECHDFFIYKNVLLK